MLTFPKNFRWGTSTSAFQIEGAVHEDGRGQSIWDVVAHTPGRIRNNDNADIACDHYHRYADDFKLMKELGYKHYRFSIAWPRIIPTGRGAVNQKGLDFYSRLVDSMLENGISPNATLYHWDLPATLDWESRDTADAFAAYTDAITRHLGDRVKTWGTLNEPWCSSILSYGMGGHAPGKKNPYLGLKTAHHQLLAHGLAAPIIRANIAGAEVGITLNPAPTQPLSTSPADYEAYRHFDGYFNRWFLDPLFRRQYPPDMIADYVKMGWLSSETLDFVEPGDLETIAAPLDFLGLNYYERTVVHAVPGAEMQPGKVGVWKASRDQMTDMEWEVYPTGLFEMLLNIFYSYRPVKIYISENGAAYTYPPDGEGKINDIKRIAYLDGHLRALHRAIQAGVPVGGYYTWSFMDNFEWAHGYSKTFGLVHTDYTTQKRTPRASAFWYGEIIQQNGLKT